VGDVASIMMETTSSELLKFIIRIYVLKKGISMYTNKELYTEAAQTTGFIEK